MIDVSDTDLTSGQRQPEEDADHREQDPVHDSLGRLPGQMNPLPADAVDAVEVQLHGHIAQIDHFITVIYLILR